MRARHEAVIGRRLEAMQDRYYGASVKIEGMGGAIDRRSERWKMAGDEGGVNVLAAVETPLRLPTEVDPLSSPIELVVPMGPQERVRVTFSREVDEAPPTPMEVERWAPARTSDAEMAWAVRVLHGARDLREFEGSHGVCVEAPRAAAAAAGGECSCGLCEARREAKR